MVDNVTVSPYSTAPGTGSLAGAATVPNAGIYSVKSAVDVSPFMLSVAFIEKLLLPIDKGVPLIVPFVDKLSPVGNVPETNEYVKLPLPSEAETVVLYGTLNVPSGSNWSLKVTGIATHFAYSVSSDATDIVVASVILVPVPLSPVHQPSNVYPVFVGMGRD